MGFTLGQILKRNNISQKDFHQVLKEEYNHSVVMSVVNGYCSKECPSPYPCWKVIQKCLKEQYGIEYVNGRWQEV